MISEALPGGKIRLYGSYLLWIGGMTVWLAACSGVKNTSKDPLVLPSAPAAAPDYALPDAWAAHPRKADLSDSLPAPWRPRVMDSTVDVFFLHPTSYLNSAGINEARLDDTNERYRWNASIHDAEINKSTDEGSILNQASAFNHYRVFAPRYRQAHIRSFYIADSIAGTFFDMAYEDVKNAFLFYLQHENGGRPFIIATHSQGTLHGGRLIKELIEGKPLQKQLVAAYLIGLPVPDNFFATLPACRSAKETGCFVSWRTFKKGYQPPNIMQETFKAVVVNPLSWTMEEGWVSRKENLGAVLYKFNHPKPHNVAASVHGNLLWSTKPRFFGNIFFTRKNYHVGDINLFWKNIRENTRERVEEYRRGG
jgi:hypothetical protein